MKELALTIGGKTVEAPRGVPTDGLSGTGTSLIQLVFSYLFIVGVFLALAFIIFSGIQWATSEGDKQKVQNARNRLTYAIVGLIVISVAFFIVKTVIILLGGKVNFFF